MSDQLIRLADRARTRDRSALEDLLRETAGVLHAVARARLGDSREAEAVVAEALARIATHVTGLRDPQAYPHWAYRITQRCIARRGRRTHRALAPLDADGPDPRPGPVDTAVALERRQVVRTGIASLPPKLREPVLLHFAGGLSYREVAALTGTGLGTVSRRMQKALGRLEALLGDRP